MNPSTKIPKGSEQFQDDCAGENFVRKRAVSQIDRKQWGIKRDLDRFYVNTVLQDQTALEVTVQGIFLMEKYASVEAFGFARDVIGSTRRCTIVNKFIVILLKYIITPSFVFLDMFVV